MHNGTGVFSDTMLEAFDAATRPVDEASILPPVLYTSREFYDFELEAVFAHEWLCVGRADQVPEPGDFRTLTIGNEPLLLVRDQDSELRVLSAVCQHRGMVLADEPGHCSRFTCPYHHWTYGLDGRLLGAPAMERALDFDKASFGLPSLPVEIWHGFVFTNFDPEPKPLAPTLAKIEPILEHYALGTAATIEGPTLADLPWNWKVMMENFNDPYHASRLHGALQTFAPSHLNEFLEWDDGDGAIARIQSFTCQDGSFNPSQKALLPVFRNLTDDERWWGSFILIPPTLALAVVPDEVAYFTICPVDPEHITIHIGYCFEDTALQDPMFEYLFAAANAGVNNFNVQDARADTLVQRGLRSRFGPHGRYAWQEETLRQFNCWLVRRYREHWPAGQAMEPARQRAP